MLGQNNLYPVHTGAGNRSRKKLLLVAAVLLLFVVLIVTVLNHTKHSNDSGKKAYVAANDSTKQVNVGSANTNQDHTVSYPDNWTVEKDDQNGGETATIKSPNGFTSFFASGVLVSSDDIDGTNTQKVGQPFVAGNTTYQLVAIFSPNEDSGTDDFVGLYASTTDAASEYLIAGQPVDDQVPTDVYGLLNPTDAEGNYKFTTVQQMQSDPDYGVALEMLKKSLAAR